MPKSVITVADVSATSWEELSKETLGFVFEPDRVPPDSCFAGGGDTCIPTQQSPCP